MGTEVAVVRSIALLGPGDACLVIDLRRYDRWVLEAARLAGERGVTLIALTDSALSPLALEADAPFTVVAASAGPFDSHVRDARAPQRRTPRWPTSSARRPPTGSTGSRPPAVRWRPHRRTVLSRRSGYPTRRPIGAMIRHSDGTTGRTRGAGDASGAGAPLPAARAGRTTAALLQTLPARQRDYEARRRPASSRLGDQELIVARGALDRLARRAVRAGLRRGGRRTGSGGRRRTGRHRTPGGAVDWLLEAARPLCANDRSELTG